MSIEIIGPKKYKFQDRVCLLLALQHAQNAHAQLEIEPRGGEDAQLVFDDSVSRKVFEIQVKGAKAKVTVDALADWLAHFPAHEAEDPLIARLVNTPTQNVMMIASGRCDDATSTYVADLGDPIAPWPATRIKTLDLANIRKGFASYEVPLNGDSPLQQQRRKAIDTLFSLLKDPALRQAVRRVRVIERLDESTVQQMCESLLQSVHGVVPDLIAGTLTALETIIFDAKGTGADVLPAIRMQIRAARPDERLAPAGYIARGDEENLKLKLTAQKVLLLAGRPRIGKTMTSRQLAGDFEQMGFIVKIAESVQSAQRFLMDPVDENRLAVVDDPFGGAHATDDALRELALLEQLLGSIRTNRRLIVVQAQDRLLEIARKKSVDEMETRGVKWIELGHLDCVFLSSVWTQACTTYSVPKWLSECVQSALSTSALDLEPGCLLYLATNHHKLSAGATLPEIIRLAREDAQTLGRALKSEGLGPLVTALAISTTPDLPVSPTELAFAMGAGGPDRPGRSKVIGKSISFGAPTTRGRRPEPQYDPLPELVSGTDILVEILESRRILEIRAGGLYAFTHPFYRASSESLIDGATARAAKSALETVGRTLLSLSPESSDAAARNLSWLYDRLDSPDGRAAVIEIAIDGLSSIFPRTRDDCFGFLVKRLTHLPSEKQSQISKWVSAVTYFNIDDVEWFNGQPRIPAGTMGATIESGIFTKERPWEEIKDVVRALDNAEATVISPEQAAAALTHLSHHPKKMTHSSAGRLLSYDVALIRAPAAAAWLSVPRADDDDLLDRIFGEEHPAVATEALKSVLAVWGDCEPERRLKLQGGLVAMANSPIAALAFIERLVLFDRIEETGDTPPWELFSELMSQVMKALPTGAVFREARLYNVLSEGLAHIPNEALLRIADHWIDLLHNSVTTRRLSDYMLGVTDILIEGTTSEPSTRLGRVERLLELPGTSARMRVVADLVPRWNLLTPAEQHALLQQLETAAEDLDWLRATAITRKSVPPEILTLILPEEGLLALSSLPAILNTPTALLNAAVHVFTGWHPEVQYIGVYGGPHKIWHPVVAHFAQQASHPLFEICWETMLSSGDTVELSEAIKALGAEHAPRLFDIMLARNMQTTGDFLPKAWKSLFEVAADEQLTAQWIGLMAKAAPWVLDDLTEVDEWVPRAFIEQFLKHMEPDMRFMQLLQRLSQLPNSSSDSDAVVPSYASDLTDVLRKLLEVQPPRHWATCQYIERMVKKLNIDSGELLTEIEALRLKLLNEREPRSYPTYPPLDGWLVASVTG